METVETSNSGPKMPTMFEPNRELLVPVSPSLLVNNLSVLYVEPTLTTYACFCSKNLVQLVLWDSNMENVNSQSLPLKESGKDQPLAVVQSKLVLPTNRSLPIVVVATVLNVLLFDAKNLRILASTPIDNKDDEERDSSAVGYRFARGITCVENIIVVGTSSGGLLLFCSTGESSFCVRSVAEHKAAIADLATCSYDQITVKQAFCGNYFGQVHVFSLTTGGLLAEINSHARAITAISVATESAYIMTASEDGYLRVFKLHSRKPEIYKIEYRYVERVDASIVGAQFLTARGIGFTLAQFENKTLPLFMIRKPNNVPLQIAQHIF